MKGKLIIVFVIVMLVLSSLACSGEGGGTTPSQSSSQQEQPSDLVGVLHQLISSEADKCGSTLCNVAEQGGFSQK